MSLRTPRSLTCSVQAERAGLLLQFPAQRPLAVDVQRQVVPGVGSEPQHLEQETVVLAVVEPTGADEVSERFCDWRAVELRDEIADHGGRDGDGLRQPRQHRLPGPLGDVHNSVEPREDVALDLADRPEDAAAALEFPARLGVLVGLRGTEVDRQDDALMRSPAGAQRGPRLERPLRVDHAVTGCASSRRSALRRKTSCQCRYQTTLAGGDTREQHEPRREDRVASAAAPTKRASRRYTRVPDNSR